MSLLILIVITLLTPPDPPTLAYPLPGVVVVTWSAPDCAWKSSASGAVFLGCEGRAVLSEGGDGARVARAGDRVWTQNSGAVVVAPPWWVFVGVVRG